MSGQCCLCMAHTYENYVCYAYVWLIASQDRAKSKETGPWSKWSRTRLVSVFKYSHLIYHTKLKVPHSSMRWKQLITYVLLTCSYYLSRSSALPCRLADIQHLCSRDGRSYAMWYRLPFQFKESSSQVKSSAFQTLQCPWYQNGPDQGLESPALSTLQCPPWYQNNPDEGPDMLYHILLGLSKLFHYNQDMSQVKPTV